VTRDDPQPIVAAPSAPYGRELYEGCGLSRSARSLSSRASVCRACALSTTGPPRTRRCWRSHPCQPPSSRRAAHSWWARAKAAVSVKVGRTPGH